MTLQKIRDWRLNLAQREGTAKILDGFTRIASGIALYSYFGDHLKLTPFQAGLLLQLPEFYVIVFH